MSRDQDLLSLPSNDAVFVSTTDPSYVCLTRAEASPFCTFHLGRSDLINSLVGVAKGHMAARSEALQLYRAILTRGKALRYTDGDYFRRQVRQEFKKWAESTDSTEIEFQIEVLNDNCYTCCWVLFICHSCQTTYVHSPWPRPSYPSVVACSTVYCKQQMLRSLYVCDLRPQPRLVLVATAYLLSVATPTDFPPGVESC